jgi:hypothetical protein
MDLRSPADAGTEGIEGPKVFNLAVTEDIEIAVVRTHAKADRVGTIPLVLNFLDGIYPAAEGESQRPLIRPVTRIAFNLDFAHMPTLFYRTPAEGFEPRNLIADNQGFELRIFLRSSLDKVIVQTEVRDAVVADLEQEVANALALYLNYKKGTDALA